MSGACWGGPGLSRRKGSSCPGEGFEAGYVFELGFEEYKTKGYWYIQCQRLS